MLDIANVSKTFSGSIHALNDVSLSAGPGIIGLLGPNGAGKSTLMKCIVGLLKPDSGSIQFRGVNLLSSPPRHRPLIGYLPQDFGVYPEATPTEFLGYLAVLKGINRRDQRAKEVDRVLELNNLSAVRNLRMGGFSGGMRQRVGVAQALLGSPELIVVDEPTAGLDPAERHRLLEALSLLRERATIVLSTHIVDDVADLCTRMVILSGGRTALQGSPRDCIEPLRGRVRQACLAPDALTPFAKSNRVLSSRFHAGELRIHFLPGGSGEVGDPVEASLEDAYFLAVNSGANRGIG